MKEVWKNIDGFDGKYKVSNFGNVYSEHKKGLLAKDMSGKYITYHLYKNNIQYQMTAHRLVAGAFLGKSDLTVDHIDGDKLNNNVENLEYVTLEENIGRRYKNPKNLGFCGATFNKKQVNFPFTSRATIRGKRFYLGSYKTAKEASEVRVKFLKDNGYFRSVELYVEEVE